MEESLSFVDGNYQGRSFRHEETLRQADFSGADLRGVDFSGVQLEGAKFNGAKLGQQTHWRVIILIGSLLLTFIASGITAFSASSVSQAFSVMAVIRQLVESLQDLMPLMQAAGEIAGNNSMAFDLSPREDVTAWAITSFYAPFCIIIKHLLRRGIRGPALKTTIKILLFSIFMLMVGSACLTFGVVYSSSMLFTVAQVAIAITLGLLFSSIASGLLFIAAMTLSIALTIAESVGPAWFAGVLAILSAMVAFLWGLIGMATIMVVMSEEGVYLTWIFLSLAATLVTNLLVIGLVLWSSWQTLNGNPKYEWLRRIGFACVPMGGTSFRGSDLTNADFQDTVLSFCDLREATLINTNWLGTTALETSRLGRTYLSEPMIRQLVVTKAGQGKKFDQLSMVGLNLAGAELEGASFTNADCSQVNFEGANLEKSKLVRTKLERASFRQASLTGAYIDNWAITSSTRLDDISCDFVFTKDSSDDSEASASRLPSHESFNSGEFSAYFSSLAHSHTLSHDLNIQPKLVIGSLRQISSQHSEAGQFASLRILALEAQQNSIDLKIYSEIPNFRQKYDECYKALLASNQPTALTENDEDSIQTLTKLVEQLKRQDRNIYLHNNGILVEAREITMSIKRQSQQPSSRWLDLAKKVNLSQQRKADIEPSSESQASYADYDDRYAGATIFNDGAMYTADTINQTTYEGHSFSGNVENFVDARNSDNSGTIAGKVYKNSQKADEDDGVGEISVALEKFQSLIMNSSHIAKNDQRDAIEALEIIHKAVHAPQKDAVEKENAEYADNRLQNFVSRILSGTGAQDKLGLTANLIEVGTFISSCIAKIFLPIP